MTDSRKITRSVLGEDELNQHIALAMLDDNGIIIWEKECVLLAAGIDETLKACNNTLFVSWCAGDLGMVARACERSGKENIVFQRALNRNTPSSKWKKYNLKQIAQLAKKYGKRLV